MKAYFPITEREQNQVDSVAESLLSGRTFALAAGSHRSRLGYHPCIRGDQYAKAVATFAHMAGRSNPLTQIAQHLIRACNPYVGADQFCAAIYEAAYKAISAGYTDVIRRSGPEAGRPSDWQRPFTLAECIATAYWIDEALSDNGNLTASVGGVGWCVEFLACGQRSALWTLLQGCKHGDRLFVRAEVAS